ncbi:MAG: type I-C CRISPR-associated protein Cas5c [Planktothrix sp.]|uniref:type I-C CRISPR-associated protein Cas5c n=1 Tax=Planktothrix sp. TaxID=3088171 RepID=UPI0038D4CFBD
MKLKIWGEYGLFTRPETKADPHTYPILTPSAAEGVLKAIFWKPEIDYVIHSITVLNPIRYQSIFRNMGQNKISPRTVQSWAKKDKTARYLITDDRSQRHHVVLKNPAYVIEFSLKLSPHATEPIDKYFAQVSKRIERGQCYRQPCLGCREYVAHFAPVDGSETIDPELLGTFKLGRILKKMHYIPDPKGSVEWFDSISKKIVKGRVLPEFFDAVMRDGVVQC